MSDTQTAAKASVWDKYMELKEKKVSGKEFNSESLHLRIPYELRFMLEELMMDMKRNGDREGLNDIIIKAIMRGLEIDVNDQHKFYYKRGFENAKDYYERVKGTAKKSKAK